MAKYQIIIFLPILFSGLGQKSRKHDETNLGDYLGNQSSSRYSHSCEVRHIQQGVKKLSRERCTWLVHSLCTYFSVMDQGCQELVLSKQ